MGPSLLATVNLARQNKMRLAGHGAQPNPMPVGLLLRVESLCIMAARYARFCSPLASLTMMAPTCWIME